MLGLSSLTISPDGRLLVYIGRNGARRPQRGRECLVRVAQARNLRARRSSPEKSARCRFVPSAGWFVAFP